MTYVDGFVVPVKKKRLTVYRRMAKTAGKLWLGYGAIEFHETVGDDVPFGKRTSFPRSVKLKRGEVVVFSWIVYRSRADRDRVMAKVMQDKRLTAMMTTKDAPFDGKRMLVGGFKTLVSLAA